ncbi:tetratricopeptide repeat protein [Nocardioides marmoriginsengisoli]|uniref:Tetratricopeptide repeat protein n=1 Tax=Nocardioides marmoriginsengisoli TaxID=661483 RepID=A0A3N0CLK2_9ACTN|nr:tetratricopeptide repeat protein [Nocardioides marmoriginsengisoli]RNL64345.1 tetratricopeptide repeat protein [Nocardioides marmoriginsengisoli]
MEESLELQAPAIVFPGQTDTTSAYRVAFDLLSRRAPDEALTVLEPALAEDPRNTGLRTLRAWSYFVKVQLGPAEKELRSLVEETPDGIWTRYALGRTLERQSRYDDALPHLRLAAAMSGDPEHELAVLRVERLAGKL